MPLERALRDRHVAVWLEGKKLRGGFAWTRLRRDKQEAWLLAKMQDDEADPRRDPVQTQPESVRSGRTIEEVAALPRRRLRQRALRGANGIIATLPAEARQKARRARQPAWVDPMLATLTNRRFSDPNWIFEHKLDGERCLAFKQGATVRLLSRNKQRLNNTYPEIAEALARSAGHDFVVDGEIVAFDGKRTSFAKLQGRIGIKDPDEARRSGIAVFYYVFDLVHVDGYDVTRVELNHRKDLLRRAVEFGTTVRFLTHRDRDGEALYGQACRHGLEGLIAKKRDSEYVRRRSTDWLKFKCINEQELVVGGFTDPAGSRVGFGALLAGYYERGVLRYAGKVGTGFDSATLIRLRRKLDALQTARPPFNQDDIKEKGAHWVKPKLVAQVGFTEWTRDGKLRHPRFLGLRTDKAARDVVWERPQSFP